jgi:hypothetical protein
VVQAQGLESHDARTRGDLGRDLPQLVVELGGHDHRDVAADGLGRVVSEESLGRRVPRLDQVIDVGGHDGLGRGLDDGAEEGRVEGQCFLGHSPGRDVPVGRDDPADRGLVGQVAEGHLEEAAPFPRTGDLRLELGGRPGPCGDSGEHLLHPRTVPRSDPVEGRCADGRGDGATAGDVRSAVEDATVGVEHGVTLRRAGVQE